MQGMRKKRVTMFPSDAEVENVILMKAQKEDEGCRLDLFVAQHADMTRSAATKLIGEGNVTLNGKGSTKNYRMRCGDTVECILPEPEPCEAMPECIPLEVVYEDDDLIALEVGKAVASGVFAGWGIEKAENTYKFGLLLA